MHNPQTPHNAHSAHSVDTGIALNGVISRNINITRHPTSTSSCNSNRKQGENSTKPTEIELICNAKSNRKKFAH
jgi:hypothetical protein